jgi:23S rRNA pseudouridine1911/1915/1917 synthase
VPSVARVLPPSLRVALSEFPRQALHAARLGFAHPRTGAPMLFETAPPADMQALLDALATPAGGDK